ncbi:GlcG/HbpS family heme-binding protein [Cedecea davisae]|uniref:GlcG/HbpS family heme-binding protein n=1 Tax=Cedecea davisae TaxID=158484 RepID=UPI00242D4A26|nr:heme-binding protein [Cedecea davisae]
MLTLTLAEALLDGVKAVVKSHDLPPVSAVVLDAGGHLTAFARMDGTFLATIDIAMQKARTAVLFQANSGDIGANLHPNGPAYSLENSNGGLVGIDGGIPLRNAEGVVIGVLGISGASKEHDGQIAALTVEAVMGAPA